MAEILVVAGEDSGDMHAASVIKEVLEINPEVSFFGIGSNRMEEAGVEIIRDLTHLSSIGFIEPIKNILFFYSLLKELKEIMKQRRPELVFLVDYSGFNMRVAKIAHQLEIPIVNYFPPSAWVWGAWRAKKMASYNAKIPSVLPMEAEAYRQAGADVEYVGHPIAQLTEAKLSSAEFKKMHSFKGDVLIGLLPGSRKGEIDKLLEPMLEAAQIIQKESAEQIDFVLPVADSLDSRIIEEKVKDYSISIKLIAGSSYEVMNSAQLIITASGTATLEAACFKCPMLIVYKTGHFNYWLSKRLVKISHVGLPNIIAGKEIVPELLQGTVNGINIADNALEIINSDEKMTKMRQELKEVANKLGTGNTIKQVAEIILETGGLE